jgi:hypothetical protein
MIGQKTEITMDSLEREKYDFFPFEGVKDPTSNISLGENF